MGDKRQNISFILCVKSISSVDFVLDLPLPGWAPAPLLDGLHWQLPASRSHDVSNSPTGRCYMKFHFIRQKPLFSLPSLQPAQIRLLQIQFQDKLYFPYFWSFTPALACQRPGNSLNFCQRKSFKRKKS